MITQLQYHLPFFVTIEVTANNEEEARDIASEEVYLTNYCGNGGSNKLIGVNGSASIEAGDMDFDSIEVDCFE